MNKVEKIVWFIAGIAGAALGIFIGGMAVYCIIGFFSHIQPVK